MVGSRPAQARVRYTPESYVPNSFVLTPQPISREQVAAALHEMMAPRRASGTTAYARSNASRRAPLSMAGPQRSGGVWETLKAMGRGALDSLPLEAGNYGPAAVYAVAHGDFWNDPVGAFQEGLDLQRGQDRYDTAVHHGARTTGKVIGTGTQVAALGPSLLAGARMGRLAEAAPMLGREFVALGGTGAGVGTLVQAASDKILRGKTSSLADLAGAALGGGTAALSVITGNPGIIGASAGGATSFAQDVFNGRIKSYDDGLTALDHAADAASDGNVLSVVPGVAVARHIRAAPSFSPNALPLVAKLGLRGASKKVLGETLSPIRTLARGGTTLPVRDVRLPLSRGYFEADSVTVPWLGRRVGELVESKMGSKLRPAQRRGHEEYLNHRVDSFVPNDVGALIEFPLGLGAYQIDPAGRRVPDNGKKR